MAVRVAAVAIDLCMLRQETDMVDAKGFVFQVTVYEQIKLKNYN